MNDFEGTIIPLAGIFCLFGLPVIGWMLTRYLAHKERMAMIERGVVPPVSGKAWRQARHQQQYGAPPPPPPFGPQPPPTYTVYDAEGAQMSLHKGIRLALIGLAIFIGLSFIGNGRGGPWLLGGLIPMFIGIAQIIIAVMAGASFGQLGAFGNRMAPPPGAAQQPPPYQPGRRPPPGDDYGSADRSRVPWEELAKPAPPPDQR